MSKLRGRLRLPDGIAALSKLWFVLIFGALICAPSLAAASGRAASRISKDELIPGELVVRGVGRTDILYLSHKDKTLLPLLAIFKYLHLKADFSSAGNTVTGGYPTTRKPFSIDLNTGAASARDTSMTISADDFTFSQDEVYLEEHVFRSLFNMRLVYNPHRLVVTVAPDTSLPILGQITRERYRQRSLQRQTYIQPDLYIPWQAGLFNFGTFDYSLTNQANPLRSPRTLYNGRLSGKFADGDLDFDMAGIAGKKLNQYNYRGYLIYPFFHTDAIGEIRLGDLSPKTLSLFGIVGAEITNRPAPARLTFANQSYDTHINGDEEAEFYGRSGLEKFTQTTNDSTYSFPYQLAYGTTDYELRRYDEFGTMRSSTFRALVPVDMVPPGTFQYSIIGGELRGFNKKYGNVNFSQGLTPVLTLGAGVEAYEAGTTARDAYPFLTGTARLMSSMILDLYLSPLGVSRGTFDFELPSQTQFTFTQMVYPQNDPFLSLGGVLSTSTASAFFPWTLRTTTMAVDLTGSNFITSYSHDRSIYGAFSVHFPRVQFLIAEDYAQEYTGASTNTDLFTTAPQVTFAAPAQLNVGAGFTYDHLADQLLEMHGGVSRVLFRDLFLQFSIERVFHPSVTFALLQINFQLPWLYFTSGVNRSYSDGFSQTTYTNSLRGSVLYNAPTGNAYFRAAQFIDHGAFLIRPFVDKNGNDIHDADEEYLPAQRVSAGAKYLTSNSSTTPSGTLVNDVEAYQDYNVSLATRFGFDDPQWVPKYRAVGLQAEPNVLKVYDFPIVVGGNVRGSVSLTGKGAAAPVEGVTVILRSTSTAQGAQFTKTTKTFSTGEFEFLAVPPGTYEVTLDPNDLRSVGLSAAVLSRQITVHAKADGDNVEGVNFETNQ